ncbi:hypothetical protein O6H91_22G005800 [Diphasiastrum complanatum]|uniref:Uncharacterized protein n=1 Tax=Diphasiastrum complanatum TaxID=34168 RepID=A0ACC2ACG3_DIPCM|nr:hypothetical protein O6H91_22G005800 [Diphasiastrum complanatum]
MLKDNTSVKQLYLHIHKHSRSTDSFNVNFMASTLSKNRTLQDLRFFFSGANRTYISDWDMKLLLESFDGNHSLASNHVRQHLWISGAVLEGAELVAKTLSEISSLRALSLDDCYLDATNVAAIGLALAKNSTLRTLSLSGNDTGVDGAAAIAMGLATNSALEKLDLTWNRIDADALEALLQPLTCDPNTQPKNSSLKALHITGSYKGTDIGSKGIRALVNMLQNNSTLTHLTVQGLNNVSEEDISSLLKSLAKNTSLQILDLSYGESVAGEKVFATIEDLLATNLYLKIIDVRHTPLEREGKEAVIRARLESKVRKQQAALELLKEMPVVSPKAARVFLCGYPFAGKTTLQKSMIQGMAHPAVRLLFSFLNLMERLPIVDRLLHGSDVRTQGVEVKFLAIGNTQVSIWDMAGQKEYHSFHDLVVPNLSGGGTPSLFLLVCNPFHSQMATVKDRLRYWLQFIASNTRRYLSTKYLGQMQVTLLLKTRLRSLTMAWRSSWNTVVK